MSKDLTFMIDLDGTLKTESDAKGPFEVESLTVQSGTKTYIFAPRPGVRKLLLYAGSYGRVHLSTVGGGGYARRVIKAMQIDDCFDRIIAAENFARGIEFYPNCIFIDNDTEVGQLKMAKMASTIRPPVRNDLWTVDTYMGNKDDQTCVELINEIRLSDCLQI